MAKSGDSTEDELISVCGELKLERLDPKKCYRQSRRCQTLKQWHDGERQAMKYLSLNSEFELCPAPLHKRVESNSAWSSLWSFIFPTPNYSHHTTVFHANHSRLQSRGDGSGSGQSGLLKGNVRSQGKQGGDQRMATLKQKKGAKGKTHGLLYFKAFL